VEDAMLDQTSSPSIQPSVPSTAPVKLWTPGFVAGVSFLLGFPAGIVIASINWMRMKMNDKAIPHLIGGGVGTLVFIIALILLPGTMGRALGLLANLGVLFYLQAQMKKDIAVFGAANRVENEGQLGGCLIGLGVLILFLILVFGVTFVFAILGVPIPE
jgi:hypothetical protein